MMFAKYLIVAGGILVLPGCLMTRDQIREGGSRSTQQSQISQAQIKKAESAARMDELEESVRAAVGRVEVVENELNQIRSASEQQENAGPSPEMNQKFLAFEEALRDLEKQIQTLAAEVQNLKTARSTSGSGGRSSQKKGNFAGAEDAFQAKEWKRAIVGYQKYRDMNPKGKWYPEATYKIGVSFQELKMSTEAKAFFEEVIAKFPKDSHAKKAQYRLKNLK